MSVFGFNGDVNSTLKSWAAQLKALSSKTPRIDRPLEIPLSWGKVVPFTPVYTSPAGTMSITPSTLYHAYYVELGPLVFVMIHQNVDLAAGSGFEDTVIHRPPLIVAANQTLHVGRAIEFNYNLSGVRYAGVASYGTGFNAYALQRSDRTAFTAATYTFGINYFYINPIVSTPLFKGS